MKIIRVNIHLYVTDTDNLIYIYVCANIISSIAGRVGVMSGSPSAAGGAAAVSTTHTSSSRSISHQSSITSQVDIVEDRKALRDALYQGIFHRHRRTIFAVGSFLRMLRSRNSQYNTIRSSSEAEDETSTR